MVRMPRKEKSVFFAFQTFNRCSFLIKTIAPLVSWIHFFIIHIRFKALQLFVSVLKFLRHRFVHTFTGKQNKRVNMAQNGEHRRRVEHNFKAQTELEIKPVEQVKNAIRSHAAVVNKVPVERLVVRKKPALVRTTKVDSTYSHLTKTTVTKNTSKLETDEAQEVNVSSLPKFLKGNMLLKDHTALLKRRQR